MINQQILDYIKQQVQQGVSREQIKNSLMTNGWSSSDIEEGFNAIGPRPPTIPPVSSPSQIPNVQQASSFINPAGDQQDFINKWSWGGFFLYAVYFIASRNYKRAFLYFLGTAVPILNIWLWIKSGLRGRKLVWESGKWQDFESYQKRQKLLDKIGLAWLLIFALIWIATFVFGYFNNTKINQQTEIPVVGQEVNQTPPTSTQATSNPDIDKVKIVLEDIRQGYLTGNEALVIKHVSIETAKFFASANNSGFKPVSNFTIGNVSPLGENMLANITSSGSTLTGPMVFIKEGGDWKLDLTATFKYAMDQSDAKKGTGDPNGLPDLVVTGVVVYPSHPVVNSKDVQITVTIKNVGTKTSDGGAPLVASLQGFAKETPVQGGNLVPLTPGETVTWDFNPYDKNDFFKVSDTPGQKTIQIVLNKDREIVESKYDNNVFTQAVQMYSN